MEINFTRSWKDRKATADPPRAERARDDKPRSFSGELRASVKKEKTHSSQKKA